MMKTLRWTALAAAAIAAPFQAQAATVTSAYSQVLGNKWSVAFTVINDGAPSVLTGLTVYFPQTFSSLLVYKAPTGWDSIAVQADPALPSLGFFDTFAMSAANALTQGQSQGGFEVRFTYAGAGTPPGALAFDINDANYNVLYSGVTTAVPEPASMALVLLGLCGIGAATARRRSRRSLSLSEV